MKLILIFLLLLPVTIFAQVPDPQPGTYINDRASILTQSDITKLNERIYALEQKYSIQLAVVLVSELPVNYAIEDYAREIGRKWHVGNARNGLVYVAAINQRKQRLEVAANLEGSIPDIEALHLTDHIKPFFRNKDYSGGLLNLVNEIDQLLNPVVSEQRALAQAELKKKEEKAGSVAGFLLLGLASAIGIGWFIYFLVSRRKRKQEPEPQPLYASGNSGAAKSSNYIAPIYIDNSTTNTDSSYSSRRSYDSDSSSSSSSSSDSSSSYGNWGSGSSDSSSSSDSGYSGGGSSNDW